jgi:hypothetical protein
MPVDRKQLYDKFGQPRRALSNCLVVCECSSLDELQDKVKQGKLWPSSIYRVKGNGNEHNPGLLAQYLFNLPSRQERLTQTAIDNMGAGI